MTNPAATPTIAAEKNPTSRVSRLLLRACNNSPLELMTAPALKMALGYDMKSGLTRRPKISHATRTQMIETRRTLQAVLLGRAGGPSASTASRTSGSSAGEVGG